MSKGKGIRQMMEPEREMEQWEKDLRAKLDKELDDGCYEISSGNYKMWTGKRGRIEYEVSLEALLRKDAEVIKPLPDENNNYELKSQYKNLTEDKLVEFMEALYKNHK